jgi:hypothetical protein
MVAGSCSRRPFSLSAHSRFGIEAGFNQDGVKKNAPANFTKGQRSIPLLVSYPAKAGAAGFIKQNFQKPQRVNVTRDDWFSNLWR